MKEILCRKIDAYLKRGSRTSEPNTNARDEKKAHFHDESKTLNRVKKER